MCLLRIPEVRDTRMPTQLATPSQDNISFRHKWQQAPRKAHLIPPPDNSMRDETRHYLFIFLQFVFLLIRWSHDSVYETNEKKCLQSASVIIVNHLSIYQLNTHTGRCSAAAAE